MTKRYIKDPEAYLDYKFDWSDWLASGESIDTYTITVPSGITNEGDSKTNNDKAVTVWLSGGTANQTYKIECYIVTNSSTPRKDERSFYIKVEER